MPEKQSEKRTAVEKQVELTEDIREEMAHRLAPVIKNVVEAGGGYTTLLDAHACLADQSNKFQVKAPTIGPSGATRAGVIIIITS